MTGGVGDYPPWPYYQPSFYCGWPGQVALSDQDRALLERIAVALEKIAGISGAEPPPEETKP